MVIINEIGKWKKDILISTIQPKNVTKLVIKKNKIVGNFVGAYDEATALEILEDEGFKQK